MPNSLILDKRVHEWNPEFSCLKRLLLWLKINKMHTNPIMLKRLYDSCSYMKKRVRNKNILIYNSSSYDFFYWKMNAK